MNIKKYTYDNYNVYIIKSKKFKTNQLYTLFLKNYKKEDITKAKLLSNFLCRTNGRCKTEIEVSKEIMNLYNPSFSIINTYLNFQMIKFRLSFLDEKYTEKGMNKKVIDSYFGNIFNPNTTGEKFEKTNFDLSKKMLETMYKREKEDPSTYGFKNAVKLISDDLPLKNPPHGCIEELEKIDEENLYEYYKEVINNSSVSIFAMGDFNEKEILKIINDNLSDKIFKKQKYEFAPFKIKKPPKVCEKIDKEKYNQSTLFMFYKMMNLTERERIYVLQVFNKIFGGPFTSKLFINVREKNSLAYSIYSFTYSLQNILGVEAGISSENYEKVVDLVEKQLKEIQNGNISKKELSMAKEVCITNLQRDMDNQSSTILTAIDKEIFNIEETEEGYKSVTIEEVINLSKKLELDVKYLLKGGK